MQTPIAVPHCRDGNTLVACTRSRWVQGAGVCGWQQGETEVEWQHFQEEVTESPCLLTREVGTQTPFLAVPVAARCIELRQDMRHVAGTRETSGCAPDVLYMLDSIVCVACLGHFACLRVYKSLKCPDASAALSLLATAQGYVCSLLACREPSAQDAPGQFWLSSHARRSSPSTRQWASVITLLWGYMRSHKCVGRAQCAGSSQRWRSCAGAA